ncbi:DUF4190 domain-containing protein [Kitasatospora terrestris]|uniref:DUF4190 domain-containing protein n=1 Tax=Kitasatospora terrestris TaxID=258051 RepID=A0ABP9E4N1_9ACTN
MPDTAHDAPAAPVSEPDRPVTVGWQRPMTRFAIASVATGVLGLWPLAAGFAVTALVKVRKGRRGKGLAIVGLVLSVLGALVTTVQFLHLDRPDGGRTVPVEALETGDCFTYLDGAGRGLDLSDHSRMPDAVVVLPCTEPHNGEITAAAPLKRGTYLEDEALRQAGALCGPALAGYRPDRWSLPEGVVPSYYYPAATSRLTRGETIHCFLASGRTLVTGSLRSARPEGAQAAYLAAVEPYDSAVAAAVPEAWASADPSAWEPWRTYAAAVAEAERKSADALRKAALPDAQRPAAAALADGLAASADAWQQVEGAGNPTRQKAAVQAAQDADAALDELAAPLRRALALASTPPTDFYAL